MGVKERAANGGYLQHGSLASFLTLAPSLPQSLGGFELRSQKLGTAYHWREEKAVELPARTPLLTYALLPLPVIVLADASHCAKGLQVVVGLPGTEAVQGLAAPRVPIGGCEVDGHLGEGGEATGGSRENHQTGQASASVESMLQGPRWV